MIQIFYIYILFKQRVCKNNLLKNVLKEIRIERCKNDIFYSNNKIL